MYQRLDLVVHRLFLDVRDAPRPSASPTLSPSMIAARDGHRNPRNASAQAMTGSGIPGASPR
jgi:hypothetical protein